MERKTRMYASIIELIPVVLGIVAVYFAAGKLASVRRRADTAVTVLSIIAAILMIVAQSSWYTSAIIERNLEGTWFANQLWTLFNSLVMLIIIIYSYPRKK